MAKDLPYFKFFCSEWSDGDITLESYEVQGFFINVCSYYWSNNCEMTFSKLKKKFKNSEFLFDELINSDIIKVINDVVYINFLNEQLIEREGSSVKKSLAGKASAEARRLAKLQQEINTSSTESQHVLNSCSTESQLLREEKRREEKIKEDKNKPVDPPDGVSSDLWSDFLVYRKRMKSPVTPRVLARLIKEADLAKMPLSEVLETIIFKGWKSFDATWVVQKTGATPPKNNQAWRTNDGLMMAKAVELGLSTVGLQRYDIINKIDATLRSRGL